MLLSSNSYEYSSLHECDSSLKDCSWSTRNNWQTRIFQLFWILSQIWNCLLNLHINNTWNKSRVHSSATLMNFYSIIGSVSVTFQWNCCVRSLSDWDCLCRWGQGYIQANYFFLKIMFEPVLPLCHTFP